jgi:glycosyltransferase involved in cell wall biosynthesis
MKHKLVYIADIRLPTEKAHGIQIMEMCSAFADLGLEVTLYVPKRHTPITTDPFDYYEVKRNFSISRLFCIDLTSFGTIGFAVQRISFAKIALLKGLFQKNTIFYTRDSLVAFYLTFFGKEVVWEGHQGEINVIVRALLRCHTKMVVISHALKNLYVSLGARSENILVSPDAVDPHKFTLQMSKEEARKKLNLPLDTKIVLYTGHLYSWKGAHTLAEAGKDFPQGVVALFVGGTEKDVQNFKHEYGGHQSIMILGNKPHQEIPLYLQSADVVVIPNSAKEDISRLYTSPMKLFEYLASGIPIVASNLPSLKEVLTSDMAVFAEADNPTSFKKEIIDLLTDESKMARMRQKSLEESKKYSWEQRAKNILDFVTSSKK